MYKAQDKLNLCYKRPNVEVQMPSKL